MWQGMGTTLLILAAVLALIGLFLWGLERGKIHPGAWRLPGDISIHRGPVHVWIPLGTCVLASLLLTLLLNLLRR